MRVPIYQRTDDVLLARRLITLGARLQMLEHLKLRISREQIIQLYIHLRGKSPPKGMLPFADMWFKTWKPNIHSSLFMSYYTFFKTHGEFSPVEILIRAYEMYLSEVSRHKDFDPDDPVLSITRAWTLVRFIYEGKILRMTKCTSCAGSFVTIVGEPQTYYKKYVCGFCNLPARAKKCHAWKILHQPETKAELEAIA